MNLYSRILGYFPIQEKPNTFSLLRKLLDNTWYLSLLIATAILSASLGMFFSRRTAFPSHFETQDDLLHLDHYSNPAIPLNIVRTAFTYNRTFGQDPEIGGETNAAWDEIIPLGQGSVRNPSDDPQVYTLSVVHQLHCLWSIHRNYYAVLHEEFGADDLEMIFPHMRHCFDYLRQSLMCASDTTLEPVDEHLGGVTGWGTERWCRNYDQVKVWAEEKRVNNLKSFAGSHKDHGH